MRYLLDMNLSPRWVDWLGERGLNAVHWSAIGAGSAEDADLVEVARRDGFVIVTSDLDFGDILQVTKGEKPSVIILRGGRISPENFAEQILRISEQLGAELEAGVLIVAAPGRMRVRMLPLP